MPLGASSPPVAGGGSYNGLTVTHYVSPFASVSGASNDYADLGATSWSNAISPASPTTLGTAMARAGAGNVVGVDSGVYTHSTGGSPYHTFVPGWHPASSGTAGSPITFVAKYMGAKLSSPLSDSTRSELIAGSGTYGGADSHPVFGANTRDYVRWIGFVCDEYNCRTTQDNGPAYIAGGTGCWIHYCAIRGNNTDVNLQTDNHTGIRVGEGGTNDSGHSLKNNLIWNFQNGFGHNAAAIITYGFRNMTIENNYVYDCFGGIYIKGSGGSGANFNYGSCSYNRVRNADIGMHIQDLDGSNDMVVSHNLVYDFTSIGIALSVAVDAANGRRAKVTRNSIVVNQSMGGNGALYVGSITGAGNEFNDNIVAMFNSTNQLYMDGGGYTANNFTNYDYNGFYGSTAGNPWSWNGGNQANIAALHAAVANSNNNQILGSDPFVSSGTGNYAVTGAALTASSTGGPIGADYSLVGIQ